MSKQLKHNYAEFGQGMGLKDHNATTRYQVPGNN